MNLILNTEILQKLGFKEAILYVFLKSYYKTVDYYEKDKIDNDGFVVLTVKEVEKYTTLSKRQQRETLKKLEELGLIETKLKDLPAKRHFKLLKGKIL